MGPTRFDKNLHDEYCWQCQRKVVPNVDVHCSGCQLSCHHGSCAKKWFPHLNIKTEPKGQTSNSPIGDNSNYQCKVCMELNDGILQSRPKGKSSKSKIMNRLFYYALSTIEVKDHQNQFSNIDYGQLCKKHGKPREAIFRAIDIESIKMKNKKFHYKCLESFMHDFNLLYHNTKIIFGSSSRRVAQMLQVYNFAVGEVDDIRSCIDCYRYYYECDERKNEDPFLKPCVRPHAVVWTRYHGFDWPAKVFQSNKPGQIEVRYFGNRQKEYLKPINCFLYSKITPTQHSNNKKRVTHSSLNSTKAKKSRQKFKDVHSKALEEVDSYLKQIGEYFKDKLIIAKRPVPFDITNKRHYFLNVKDHYSLIFRYRNYDREARRRLIRRDRRKLKAKSPSNKVSPTSKNNSQKKPTGRKSKLNKELMKPVKVEIEQNEEMDEEDKNIYDISNMATVEHPWMKQLDLPDPTKTGVELLKTNCFDFSKFGGNKKLTELFSKINQQIQRNNKMFAKCVAHEKTISALKKNIQRYQEAIKVLEPTANYYKANEWCNTCMFPAKIYCCLDACYCSEECQRMDQTRHRSECLDKRRRIESDSSLELV